MSSIQVGSYRPGSLAHSGVSLSLVILRGALENLETWCGDVDPLIGGNRSSELARGVRGWSVPAERVADQRRLCAALDELRAFWSVASPTSRRELVADALSIARVWLAELDGSPS